MNPTDALIARVLDLDAKATKGPWASENGEDNCRGYVVIPCPVMTGEWSSIRGGTSKDANLIAEYRTAAPKLARALKIAVEALETSRNELGVPQPGYPAPVANAANCIREALQEITKLVEGE